eukprot:9558538-Lingulodinium_polyedra.AAC.1
MHRPRTDHAQTMHRPCIDHAQTMHRPCIDHASTIHRPFIDKSLPNSLRPRATSASAHAFAARGFAKINYIGV